MFKHRHQFNIDKFKLCYNQPEGLFSRISEYSTNDYIDFDCFQLHIFDDGRGENGEKEPIKIKANVILSDGFHLGDFVFCNSVQYDGRCFFTFANPALYQTTTIVCGEKYNYQTEIDYIIDVLGLKLNNFTEIEIALDVNFNILPKVQKLVKDYQNYDMIVNNKRVTDENRKIENYGEYYGRSRAKRDKYPTIYFAQSKSDGLQLRIYDKSREIKEENPHKEYIEAWNGFSNQKVFRVEFTIKNEQFKKWLQNLNSTDCPLLSDWKQFISEGEDENIAPSEPIEDYMRRTEQLLLLQDYKCSLWQFCADRVIYWRDKATNEVISLLDVANARPKCVLTGV